MYVHDHGKHDCSGTIGSSYASLATPTTPARLRCCRDFRCCSTPQPPREEFLRVWHAQWRKSSAEKFNIHCTNLPRSSWSERCPKSTEDRCSNGLQKAKSKTDPGSQCRHDSETLRKLWRRWRMRQGFAKHIKRRVAKRRLSNVLQWFGIPSPGFYWKWIGTLNIQYTWLGPKSEPCVAPRRHHCCAPRILWFMVHMTMIGNAGGVRVVHSHLMCTGAMAEALAPAVANEGGRRYTVRPPTFPRARK